MKGCKPEFHVSVTQPPQKKPLLNGKSH